MTQREIKVINGKQYLCCNKCGEFKEASTDNRPKNKRGQLGLGTWCKSCMSIYAKNNKDKYSKYYYNNRDKRLKYIKKYNREHKEEISEQRKRYYQENKELFAERNKKRYESNRDIILQQQKEYYKINKEAKRKYAKQHRIDNKDKIKEHYKENRGIYAENRKNNAHYKEYMKKYEQEHKDKILARKKKKLQEMGYGALHLKTARAIKKLGIRPDACPICGEKTRVEAHHPDYNKRNEIIFACNKCHQRIHNGWIECPKNIIDITK